jgi:outer membrane protein TolC
MLFNVLGDLIAPLVNRNTIKAEYYSANSKQIQAAYKYEQAIINAYVEVANQLSSSSNLTESLKLRTEQVNALNASISIASNLFKSAEADYMEVLMTQRDALEAKFELVETKMNQLKTSVNLYKALGGGWK